MILGHPGSGCTAFAWGLHYYGPSRGHFAVHIPGQPNLDEIYSRFINHLQDFVLHRPTYLRRLTGAYRELLVSLIVSKRNPKSLLAEIETAQVEILSPFSSIIDNEKESAIEQLQLLQKAVESIDRTDSSSILKTFKDIWLVVRKLGFKKISLVLDVQSLSGDNKWLQDRIIPNMMRWQHQGIMTILFVPTLLEGNEDIPAYVYRDSIIWRQSQLRKMLRWRYKVFAPPRHVLEEQFEENVLDDLMVQMPSVTPRKFIQLWRKLIEPLDYGEKITGEHVQKVIAEQSPIDRSIQKSEEDVKNLGDMESYESQDIKVMLNKYFNLAELKQLCSNIDINYEDIPDRETIAGFAREIVEYSERHEMLEKLIRGIYEERPFLFE